MKWIMILSQELSLDKIESVCVKFGSDLGRVQANPTYVHGLCTYLSFWTMSISVFIYNECNKEIVYEMLNVSSPVEEM